MSLLDSLRVNKWIHSWTSCTCRIDNLPTNQILAINYEQRLQVTVVPSNRQDTAPMGMSGGQYSIPGFTITMLRSAAEALTDRLMEKADGGGYGSAVFEVLLQVAEDSSLSSMHATHCRITGKRDFHEEGIDELVTEFEIGCLWLTENGKTLWNARAPSDLTTLDSLGVDYIQIGTDRSPGKCTIRGFSVARSWDIRKGFGFTGATLVPMGDDPARGTLHFELWTAEQYDAWNIFAKKYFSRAAAHLPGSSKPKTLGIKHPVLNGPPLEVDEVVVEECTALENDGYGVWRCEVKLIQYRAPRPALERPQGKIPAAAAPQPTANDWADLEMLAKTAQLQKLMDAP